MTASHMLLKADLRRDEGERLDLYKCPAGKWTIGVGHNLEARGIPQRVSDMLLEEDIYDVDRDLDRNLPEWRMWPEPVSRAVSNMVFQLGIGGFLRFKKTVAHLKAGRWQDAADEALDSQWAKQTPERAKRVTDLMRSAQ